MTTACQRDRPRPSAAALTHGGNCAIIRQQLRARHLRIDPHGIAGLVEDRDLAETTPHRVGSFNCYHPAMQEVVLRLAVEAGAEVRRGVTVEAVVPGNPPSVHVQEDGQSRVLQARLVVGADGRASRVRRWGGFTVTHDPDGLVIAGTLLAGTPVPDEATYFVPGPDGSLLMAPSAINAPAPTLSAGRARASAR